MEAQVTTPEGTFTVSPQPLADVELQLAPGTSEPTLPSTVQRTLAPTPRTTIRYDFPDDPPLDTKMRLFTLHWEPGPIHAVVTHQGNNLRAQLLLLRTDPYAEFLIQELESGNDKEVKHTQEVGFKVINMKSPDLLGGRVDYETGGWELFGAVVLTDDEWTVQIRQAPNHRGAQRYLRSIGGYQITHVGSICKDDGSLFSQEEAQEELNILRSFLSFCNGSFVGLTEIRGTGQDWKPLWEVWKDHNVGWSNGSENNSWIPDKVQANKMMESLFPGFGNKYRSDKKLRSLVYRYLQANQTQPDIDPQTAEVIGRAAMNLALNAKTKWKRLAQELERYGISLDIPDKMPNLRKLHERNPPKNEGIKPGPSILNHIRNAHEHSDKQLYGTEEDYYTKALFEAWHLGQQYTEAIVLSRCGYPGKN